MPDDAVMTPPATGDPQPSSSRYELIAILSVLALLVAGIAYWATPRPRVKGRVVSVAGPSDRAPRAEYVGSNSCKECHPGEEALYHRSGHSRTLRAIAQTPLLTSLDGRSVADPERPGVTWTYRRENDTLTVDRRQGDAVASYPIDYALGSGRNAATLVAVVDADPARFRILEHRLTHYRDGDALRLTPGHSAGATAPADPAMKPYGRALGHEDSAKCVNCHATRTSAAGPNTPVVLAEMTPNVSCERCHGPAGDHVAAARRGATGEPLKMPAGPGRQTAAEQMTLCGQCHHHPDRAFAGEIDLRNPNLVRFQPVGLMQSKCYLKTEGHLSCTACHDPHDRPGTTASRYETTCISCHSGPKSTPCKVSPKGGCIPCHMPKTPTAQGFPFTDHWIRVIRDGPAAKPPGRFVPDDAGG